MLIPDLAPDYFTPDRLVEKRRLYGPADFTRSAGAGDNDGGVFESRENLKAAPPVPSPDISKYNQLSLRLINRSPRPLLIGLSLIHNTPLGESQTPVSFSGGREYAPPDEWVELKFPRSCFGIYGRPDGWSEVKQVLIHISREKNETASFPIKVVIHSLDGEILDIPRGPRLTRAGFDKITDGRPDVSAFFKQHRLYSSPAPGLGFNVNPPHSYPVEPAGDIMNGLIMGEKAGRPIDWAANPRGEMEWTHFLNRHHFLRELIKAGGTSEEPQAITTLAGIIRTWIQDNPAPIDSNGGAGPAWETLSTAWRLREWLWVIGLAWPSPYFCEDAKELMLRSIWEHATALSQYQGHPNNWLIVESAALTLAGLCFPFFRGAKDWTATGLERLEREFDRQFFPDGAHYELSPLYHSICVSALLEVKQAALSLNQKLPDFFGQRLEKAFEYLAALARPDFTWPSINDSGGVNRQYLEELEQAGSLFNRTDFKWIGSVGRGGTKPVHEDQLFQDAGLGIMRFGRPPESHMLVFRSGPAGAAHVHDDALSLDVTVFGRPVLVDPGVTAYAPGELTDYYRSAEAHNAILINGEGAGASKAPFRERIEPARNRIAYQKQGKLNILTGLIRGPWGRHGLEVEARRNVILVDRLYWVVWDLIEAERPCRVGVCWKFSPGKIKFDRLTGIIETDVVNSGFLRLIPLPGESGLECEMDMGNKQNNRGWVSSSGGDLAAARLKFTSREAVRVSLIWILLPVHASSPITIKASRRDEPGGPGVLVIDHPQSSIREIKYDPAWLKMNE